MKSNKVVFILILCLSHFLLATAIKSQSSIKQEKIETIIRLTRFVDWSQNTTFSKVKKILYVITDQQIPTNFEIKSKNTTNYKNWQIICSNNIDNVQVGSVIFISKDQQKKAKKVIALSEKKDILTVSDNIEDFCYNGGMINLVDEDNQVNFEINYSKIQNKNLDISSKLLALAKIYD